MDRPDIPVWRTARAAWGVLYANFGVYLRLSCVPFALILAANAAMTATGFGGTPAGPAASVAELFRHLLGILLEWSVWLAMAPVATAWSRMATGRQPAALTFSSAERDYILRYFLLILLLFAAAAAPGRLSYGIGHELRATIGVYPMFLAQAASYPVFLAGLIVAMRLSLILPAAAGQRPLRPRDSWRLVRSNELAVAGVLVLASLPAIPLQFAMALATDGVMAGDIVGIVVVALRKTLVLWLVWPVWAAALALLHHRLVADQGTGPRPVTGAPAATPAR